MACVRTFFFSFFLPVWICEYVFTMCFLCVHSSVSLHALDNDNHELCMWCDAFHSISALIFPQTTLQRRVSGHLAVNKLELIDFNSGQHPSAKHSPGSKLNKLPSGPVLRSAPVHYHWLSGVPLRLRKTDLKSAFSGHSSPHLKGNSKNGSKLTKAKIFWIFAHINAMLHQQRILCPEQKLINKSNCLILCGLIVSSGHNCTDFIHIELNASEQVCVRGFRLHVLFSVKCSGYVAIHEWPYIPCLWSVTLSSLITRCLWLRSGSERSLSLPLFLSLPLSLFRFLCPMRFIALQEPQALLFSAWGALLNTCDIGSMCMWLCMSMYLYPCVLMF